jgi:putative acetyltransferase
VVPLIRPYARADADATLQVFLASIRVTAASDYTPEQVAVWARDDIDVEAWGERRAALHTAVAAVGGRVVGFTDVDAQGYIDMMFVDPSVGRSGVGSALLRWVRDEALRFGAASLTTRASLTARPFFAVHGFEVVQEHHPVRRGVTMTNFAMSRALH